MGRRSEQDNALSVEWNESCIQPGWWTGWESLLVARGFELSYVVEQSAIDVYHYIYHALKIESNDRVWGLIYSGQAHRTKAGQKEMVAVAESIGNVGIVRKKPWQMVDSETAVDIIGLDIKVQGEEWLMNRPEERAFLERVGVTPEQAVQIHQQRMTLLYKKFGRDEKGTLLKEPLPADVHSAGLGGNDFFRK